MSTKKQNVTHAPVKCTLGALAVAAVLLAGCSSSNDHQQNLPPEASPEAPPETPPQEDPAPQAERVVLLGSDLNNIGSPLLSLNPDGPGGSPNQSLRSGDVLQGGSVDNVIIGALGVDLMIGGDGDDVLIGGTEDFNANVDGDDLGSDNRDKAFGGNGEDVFIWAPGDGSDFYDGGPGVDVVVFGLLGEERDNSGLTTGAPFFGVSPPGTDGSQNFDGIFLDAETRLPTVSVSGSPGFCSVIDDSTNPDELAAMSLDHLVRFSLRGVADAFDAGERSDDDGLRVALSLRNVEYVVCTRRAVTDGGGVDNIEVLNLATAPPTIGSLTDLPEYIQEQIQ